MELPVLSETSKVRLVTNVFKGLEKRECPSDGQLSDMKNLTSERYPVMSERRRRGVCRNISSPRAMTSKDALIWVDSTKLVYNSAEYEMGLSDTPKQLVSMGAYVVIFPDKKYFNTADVSDRGSIEAQFITTPGNTVTFQLSGEDGSEYVISYTASSAPEQAQDGECWLDVSGSTAALRKYSAASDTWVSVSAVYVKITYTGVGTLFNVYDGISISGVTASGLDGLNGYSVVCSRGDGYIVVPGIMPCALVTQSDSLTVKRECPDMDFVCEAGNRLWGCKYGISGGKAVNELYASKLGDFRNWVCYRGISTDSWAAGVGSDGVFTAAVSYKGCPLFFKEDCLHKIYISESGAHQVQTVNCRGVKSGCHNSVQTVDETLMYLSPCGICAYDGSLPVSVGEELSGTFVEAAAGVLCSKYYVSLCDTKGVWSMYVYDFSKGLWHREDSTHALYFAKSGSELYFIDSDNRLVSVNGTDGTVEPAVSWEAVSSVFGYGEPGHKYLSRFSFSMYLPQGSRMSVYVQYDSSGEWELSGSVYGSKAGSFNLPVIPRRCDRFQIKLVGTGEFRLYSFSRILETGSDENCR